MAKKETIDHSQRSHALLSASGADRWLSCPPSARLEAELPDTSSKFAKEGTLAHEFCDNEVKLYFSEISKAAYTRQKNALRKKELYDPEMENYSIDYLNYITEKVKSDDAIVLVEEQLDFSEYVPDGFGTGDCIIIQDKVLTIIDYKYGKGIAVSAKNNPQMKLYALGAISMFNCVYDFDKVEMCIFQPRLSSVDESVESVSDLIAWGDKVVKPTADLAYEGRGEFQAGNHCTFCKARQTCRHLNDYCMETIRNDFEDESGKLSTDCLTPEDIAMIVGRTKLVKNWLTDVEEYAVSGMLNGDLKVPGYKIVEGRSIRKYKDADEVEAILLSEGYDASALYTKELMSLSKMEKFLGKKTFSELIGDLVDKPKGKPTIVPENDKRPIYTQDDDFEVVIPK